MQNVLIVIPAEKEPQQAIRAALELAKQRGGNLVALVVLDPNSPARAASTLTEVGFMGEQLGSQVSEALLQQYRARSEALLQALVEQGRREGVAVTPIIAEGDTADVCGRVIRTHQIGTAVLVAEKRSWLTRFLSRSAAVKLPAFAGCAVSVMEED